MKQDVFVIAAGCALASALMLAQCSSDGVNPNDGGGGGDGTSATDGPITTGDGVAPFGDGGPTLPPAMCPDPPGGGRVLYVDGQNGKDTNDGLSEGAAFKTLGKAVGGSGAPLLAGDTVLVKKGIYRERLDVRKSGSASQRIVIRPFQQDAVIVDGSDSPGAWSIDAAQVYKSTPGFAVQAVVVDDVPLIPATSHGTITEGQFFWDSGAGTLYVWAPGGGDPTTRDVGVVAVDDNKTQQAIYLDQANYVTLCGLTTRFAGAKGILILGDYDRVDQCRVAFNGGIGLSVGPYQNVQSTDAEVVSSEIDHNFMRNWPRCSNGYKTGGWGTGASSQNAPNTRFIGNIVHDNGGEGLVAYGGTQGVTMQNNIAYDNWSVNLYVLDTQNVTITGNLAYSTGPRLGDLTNNGDPSPSDNRCAKTLRPIGIATGDESLGGTLPLLDHVVIANNVMINGRYGTSHVAEVTGSGIKDATIAFNTIVVPETAASYENVSGIDIPDNAGNNAGTKVQDNVVFGKGAGVLLSGGGASGFTGLTIDHNLWFHSGNAKPFSWNGTTLDHAGWVALSGGAHGAGDVTSDPMLVDANAAIFDPAKKCPGAGSPALDVGVDLGVAADFFGTARPQGSGFDLGACELK